MSEFERKQMILVGQGRQTSDVAYICEMEGYACASAISEIKKDSNAFYVICEPWTEKAEGLLREMGLLPGTDYVFAEDMALWLADGYDEPWEEREIAIWGTGNTAKDLLDQCKVYEFSPKIAYYINSNAAGEKVGEYDVHKPSENPGDTLVVLACGAEDQIACDLKQKGWKQGEDFVTFKEYLSFLQRQMANPAKMMRKLLEAKSTDFPCCREAFEDVSILPNMIKPCSCGMWLNVSIGNPMQHDWAKIWNCVQARIFRRSVINKTFCFCIQENCPHFNHHALSDPEDTFMTERGFPKNIYIGIDDSCNLVCSQCRSELIYAKGKELEDKMQVADNLVNSKWLENAEAVFLASFGEVFASKVYDRILRNAEKLGDTLSIVTNMQLFSEEKWNLIRDKARKICFKFSLDGATKNTYESIRKGGSWERLNQNLILLAKLKKEGLVDHVRVNTVAQRENYKELEQIADIVEGYGFDELLILKLLDIHIYSYSEYCYRAMFDENGNIESDLLDELDKIKNRKIVGRGKSVLDQFLEG